MELSAEHLHELFVTPGHVSKEDFERAVEVAKKTDTSVEQQIVQLGFVNDYNLGKTIADEYEFDFINLPTVILQSHFFDLLPEVVARAQMAIVCDETDDTIFIATIHPDNYIFKKRLEKKYGKRVVFSYTTHEMLLHALSLYKGNYQTRIEELIQSLNTTMSNNSVVELLELLLEYGHVSKASDIHIEPLEETVRIRFRIDGVLHTVATYPIKLHEQVAFRVKILSHLQTDEHGKAQDGRFSHALSGATFDIRVSIIPITNGENIVMRLLSATARQFTLDSLGFSENDLKKIKRALTQPHGMILSVGPTGSGKTTVLYTLLEYLNTSEINIMTIEDPVEYDIESVQQTQVNHFKDLTFANGLRSIVRQDPDVIMVGEIRDEETADIAVNAALTGHLLLSTLHTNDAATTFPRFTEMGVEPFLVASSVRIIISIRLVRTICPHCKESYFLSKDECAQIESDAEFHSIIVEESGKEKIDEIRFYRGVGCVVCHESGFIGRNPMFEILTVDEEIRLLVSQNATSDAIHDRAVSKGMTPLVHDGVIRALRGQTTIFEVMKAANS